VVEAAAEEGEVVVAAVVLGMEAARAMAMAVDMEANMATEHHQHELLPWLININKIKLVNIE
jgi:hypothetical protein